MENILDIIIPHYKESKEMLDNALNSISIQEGIDFRRINVIIVNDCGNPILDDELKIKYRKLNIVYLCNEINLGPGLTRQRGLNASMAKYVTFLDCDDEFYSNAALTNVIDRMEQYNDNVLVTSIIEEVFINGRSFIFKHMPNEIQGLHGIFYKRQYLVDNNIKFHNELWHCEDSYFYRISTYITKIDAIDYVTYKWNYNENSIVRQKRELDYSIVAFKDHLNQIVFTYDFVKEKGCAYGIDFLNQYLVSALIGMHILLNSTYFSDKALLDSKNGYKKRLKDIYNQYIDVFNSIDDFEKVNLFKSEFNSLSSTNPKIKKPNDIISFINSIGK
ncbi:MAG: glycosyltransferase family 2 protein [Acholeplasmatales bacterium]|nr:glycosyltransferase family 2 protein [Acholeplasmatales bacterium]